MSHLSRPIQPIAGTQLRAACCRPVQRSRSLVATAFLGTSDKAAVAPKAPKPKAAPAATKPAKAVKPAKPVEPKAPRAPSAFNLYMADAFKAAAQANPDLKSTKLMATIVAQWKALPADKRQPYEAESEKRKKEVAAIREEIKAEKKKNARPLNAYMALYVERLPKIRAANPGKPLAEVAKIFKAEWDALPAADKEARQAAYQQARESWNKAHPKA